MKQSYSTSRRGRLERLRSKVRSDKILGVDLANVTLPANSSLQVLLPDGNLLVNTVFSGGAGAGVRIPTLPVAGTYTVRVIPAGGGTGSVQLTLWSDVTGALAVGAADNLTVAFRNQEVRKTFTGAVGQNLGVDLANVTLPANSSLQVLLPDGNLLVNTVFSGGAGAGVRIPTLPVAGTYHGAGDTGRGRHRQRPAHAVERCDRRAHRWGGGQPHGGLPQPGGAQDVHRCGRAEPGDGPEQRDAAGEQLAAGGAAQRDPAGEHGFLRRGRGGGAHTHAPGGGHVHGAGDTGRGRHRRRAAHAVERPHRCADHRHAAAADHSVSRAASPAAVRWHGRAKPRDRPDWRDAAREQHVAAWCGPMARCCGLRFLAPRGSPPTSRLSRHPGFIPCASSRAVREPATSR